jgi:hypothetical protein
MQVSEELLKLLQPLPSKKLKKLRKHLNKVVLNLRLLNHKELHHQVIDFLLHL